MIIKGYSMPSLIVAMRIVQYSNKEITYDDILKPYIDHIRAKNLIPDMYSDDLIKTEHEAMIKDNHRKLAPKLKLK